jgi:hypothetical protein
LRFAQLDPFQQANFAIGRGANMLGGAIGGALGGQDPELQRITMRQQVAGQLNPNDLSTFEQAFNALAPTDPEGAMMVRAELEKVQMGQAKLASENALTEQRTAAATASLRGPTTAAPTTNDLTNARAIAALAGPEGSPEYNDAFRAEYQRLTAPKEAKGPGFGAEAERVAAELFDNKTFADLTPTQKAVVNRRVDAESRARTPTQTFVLPGDKSLVDIPAFRAKVQSTINPQLQAVNATDNALTAIQDSLNTGNFISFNAARVQLARSLGDSQLSRRDIEQAGGDPSILGGMADAASTLFTGTPTVDTQNKIKSTLLAIKKVATDKANAEIDRQRKLALRSPGYDAAAVNAALDFPQFSAAPVAAGGGTLAEQAAAELKRRQSKGK